MADRPELLRLFDIAESPFDIPSKTETTDAMSRNTTTPKAPSAEETHDSGAPERDGDAEVLRRCVVAAGLMNHARVEFDDAVAAARATGHTWRQIGNATRIPHQTLHRRSGRRNTAGNDTSGPPPRAN
jgi:hypothetical protein